MSNQSQIKVLSYSIHLNREHLLCTLNHLHTHEKYAFLRFTKIHNITQVTEDMAENNAKTYKTHADAVLFNQCSTCMHIYVNTFEGLHRQTYQTCTFSVHHSALPPSGWGTSIENE